MTIRKRAADTGQIVAHEPTPETRAMVKTAAGLGLPIDMIVVLAGLGSDHTLRKHYADELKVGKAQATFQVAQTLFHRATVGKDLGAAIFWLKAQAGWREKHVLDDPATKLGLLDLINAAMASQGNPLVPGDTEHAPPKVTRQ